MYVGETTNDSRTTVRSWGESWEKTNRPRGEDVVRLQSNRTPRGGGREEDDDDAGDNGDDDDEDEPRVSCSPHEMSIKAPMPSLSLSWFVPQQSSTLVPRFRSAFDVKYERTRTSYDHSESKGSYALSLSKGEPSRDFNKEERRHDSEEDDEGEEDLSSSDSSEISGGVVVVVVFFFDAPPLLILTCLGQTRYAYPPTSASGLSS